MAQPSPRPRGEQRVWVLREPEPGEIESLAASAASIMDLISDRSDGLPNELLEQAPPQWPDLS